jgi:DNA primase
VRFDDRFLDEIKSRLRLSDVIGRTVKLRRQGREYAGLSPFTKEKTPSFYVNDEKGFYHCFSSGKHGDLISFLQETERLSFPEAIERLAAEAGVPMPVQDARQVEQDKKRNTLQDWLETAAAWFEGELKRPGGQAARAYLQKRQLPEDAWKRFRIGFAPAGRTALKDYLVQKGARPADLVQAGLLIAPEDGGAPYDRFRDRIIFPITDLRGRVVSFGGRALDPEAKAKYLNGPETDLFSKSQVLYGLYEARKLLGAGDADAPLVVVEGYMDVVACQRAGIPAVAGMGTALTEEQMALMWRFHPEPTLCFDGDGAGQRAAARVIDRALPGLKSNRSFKFAIVTGGKDPDDVLREQGAAALKAQLAQTISFVDALFTRERDLEPLDTPERRAGLKARLRAAAAAIQDKDLAQAYREELLARFDALFARSPAAQQTGYDRPFQRRRPFGSGFGGARPGDDRFPDRRPPTQEGMAAARRLAEGLEPIAAAVAKGALMDPSRLDARVEVIEAHGLGHPALNELVSEIIRLRLEADVLDSEALTRHLAARGFGALLGEIDRAARISGAPFLNPDLPPASARTHWSHAFDVLIRMAALEAALSTAKAELTPSSDTAAFMRLKGERDALKRAIRTGTVWTAPDFLIRDPSL